MENKNKNYKVRYEESDSQKFIVFKFKHYNSNAYTHATIPTSSASTIPGVEAVL